MHITLVRGVPKRSARHGGGRWARAGVRQINVCATTGNPKSLITETCPLPVPLDSVRFLPLTLAKLWPGGDRRSLQSTDLIHLIGNGQSLPRRIVRLLPEIPDRITTAELAL